MKYAKSENVKIVLSLLKQHGIRHVVVSPGGTNIPVAQGLQEDDFFTCHSVVDERSAMYYAIGLYLELGEPVAATCTSAQATRNYIPGLTEAYYKHVPILAITCSKHPRHTYQEYMQAPDQTSLPRDAVKKSFALPHVVTTQDRLFAVRLANEGILELTHHGTGPVQLNLPIVDSERLAFEEIDLPVVRKIERHKPGSDWNGTLTGKKIMVVAGEHRRYHPSTVAEILRFTENYDAIVYTNLLSNLSGSGCVAGNLTLSAMSQAYFNKELCPDIIITIGGQTGDYPLFGKLCNAPKSVEHWRVSIDGDVVDTYDKLTHIFECSTIDFFRRYNEKAVGQEPEHTYLSAWEEHLKKNKYDVELPLSNIYVAQQLHRLLPKGSNLNLAILNSLRSWSFFPVDSSVDCFSPVAAFGIDGAMSMTIGQSVASDKLCFLVTGDLAFFYDMNSMGIRDVRPNLRILLINNGRGTEFTVWGKQALEYDNYISAANHYGSIEGWCTDCGFKYLKAKNKQEFSDHVAEFVSQSERPIVFEVKTDSEDEAKALSIMIKENMVYTPGEDLKQQVKSILGETISGILRKFN